jgi:hypothetical protein
MNFTEKLAGKKPQAANTDGLTSAERMSDLDDNVQIAALYYYYLSLDRISGEEKKRHLETLFDIRRSLEWYLSTLGLKNSDEKLPEDDENLDRYLNEKLKNPEVVENFCIAIDGFADAKDDIIRLCEETIAEFPADERYERIVEEIDRILLASLNTIVSYTSKKYFWVFVMYSSSANILSEQKRKFLKHFARIAEIDKTMLPEMESLAKAIVDIGKKRSEIKSSDDSYSKVVAALALLDTEEAETTQRLNKLLGIESEEEDEDTDEDDDDRSPVEKLAVDAIEVVGGAVAGALNGIADVLDDLVLKL